LASCRAPGAGRRDAGEGLVEWSGAAQWGPSVLRHTVRRPRAFCAGLRAEHEPQRVRSELRADSPHCLRPSALGLVLRPRGDGGIAVGAGPWAGSLLLVVAGRGGFRTTRTSSCEPAAKSPAVLLCGASRPRPLFHVHRSQHGCAVYARRWPSRPNLYEGVGPSPDIGRAGRSHTMALRSTPDVGGRAGRSHTMALRSTPDVGGRAGCSHTTALRSTPDVGGRAGRSHTTALRSTPDVGGRAGRSHTMALRSTPDVGGRAGRSHTTALRSTPNVGGRAGRSHTMALRSTPDVGGRAGRSHTTALRSTPDVGGRSALTRICRPRAGTDRSPPPPHDRARRVRRRGAKRWGLSARSSDRTLQTRRSARSPAPNARRSADRMLEHG